MKNSQIRQFKYFKVLVQEFHIKVDLGFVNAVVDMLFSQANASDEEEVSLIIPEIVTGSFSITFFLETTFLD